MLRNEKYLSGLGEHEWVDRSSGSIIEPPSSKVVEEFYPPVIDLLYRPGLRSHREARRLAVEERILARAKPARKTRGEGTRKSPKRKPKVPSHLRKLFESLPPEKQEAMLVSIAQIQV